MDCQIQVSADGGTVWVNDAYSCLGRFSKTFGMDVHRSMEDQLNGAGQCLHCTHTAAGLAEWHQFVELMHLHFGVTVPPDLITFPEAV
jgi:hypothetical protein